VRPGGLQHRIRYDTFKVPTMVGWKEQWYDNVPAVEIALGALVAPGAMDPVSKPVPVAVWAKLSALRHDTVCPTFTDCGFGEYDCAAAIPLIVMVTSAEAVPVPVGAVVPE
jgi:hypothetical protein